MLRLRELRESRDLSQKEVAKHINRTPQAYSLYELGTREPDITTLIKLADYYAVSVDYLVNHTMPAHATPEKKELTITTKAEIRLISVYRSVSPANQKDMLKNADFVEYKDLQERKGQVKAS